MWIEQGRIAGWKRERRETARKTIKKKWRVAKYDPHSGTRGIDSELAFYRKHGKYTREQMI